MAVRSPECAGNALCAHTSVPRPHAHRGPGAVLAVFIWSAAGFEGPAGLGDLHEALCSEAETEPATQGGPFQAPGQRRDGSQVPVSPLFFIEPIALTNEKKVSWGLFSQLEAILTCFPQALAQSLGSRCVNYVWDNTLM